MKEEALTLDTRKTIYTYIRDNPGQHLRGISRALNIQLGTLRYHLNYLEIKGVIVGKKEKNLKVYFVTEKISPKDKNLAPLLQQKRFRDIILVVIINPKLTHSEISTKLSINPSTLSKYINILETRGILYHEKIGREKQYYVLDEKMVMELLLTYKKSFWDSFVDNVLEIYFER
jgi:predicted transcriptional regulator